METKTSTERPTDLYRRALRFAIPYWRKLGFVLFVSLVSTLLSLAQPYFLKLIIDDAFLAGDFGLLLWVSLGFFAVSLASLVLGTLSSYRYVMVSARALFDIRVSVFEHLQRLSPRFFAANPMGDLLSRLNNDVSEIQRIASDTFLNVLTSTVMLVGTAALLWHLEPRLFLVSVALTPVSIWVLSHYREKVTEKNLRVRERSAEIGNFLVEAFLGMRQTIASHQQGRERQNFAEKNDRFIQALSERQWTNYLASGIPAALTSLGTLIVFLLGGYWVVQGSMTLGSFVAFTAYQARLMGPLQGLMGLYLSLRGARASLGRVFELLDSEPEVIEKPDAEVLGRPRKEIAFDDVCLSYQRGGPVLDRLSFSLPVGSVVAIVGPSGVGKSTIADLLLRRLEPDAGEIRIDGKSLDRFTLGSLRRQVAVVEQETFLWNATIEENIRYARPDASSVEVEQAARRAAIHQFILTLPQGYLTRVGERGLQLSSGQRQRVAIARAFIQEAPILVLDEASAALDGASEAEFLEETGAWLEGRTVLVLTHRLPMVMLADEVLVLQEGRIVERGAPSALLTSEGAFSRLFGDEARLRETSPQ